MSELNLISSHARSLVTVALAALVLAACTAPAASVTPLPQAAPTASQPADLPQPAAEATLAAPAAAESPYYPPETRTGVTEVDKVIDALLAGDQAALVGLARSINTGCTHADGLGGPPKCATDQPEGTSVEVFPILGSEGAFLTHETILNAFPSGDYALYSVYRVADDAEEYPYWPAGKYGLTFVDQASGTGLILLVDDTGIVRIVYTFPGQDLAGRDIGEYILPPKT